MGSFAASANTSFLLGSNTPVPSGTANGVLYLNGSKVPTSGNALTFDGTNLKIGTTTASSAVLGALSGAPGNVSALYIGFGGSNNYFDANLNIWRSGAQIELMRLNSTGLGIGTSNPQAKLVVSNAGAQGIEFGYSAGLGSNFLQSINRVGGADVNMAYFLAAGGSHQFYNNGTLSATLNSAGNLGLGVTPSAWSGLASALQVQRASIVTSSAAAVDTYFSSNAFYDGSWKYMLSNSATQYIQNASGDHRWRVAASGTAGNTISFTQAMTLDASGNLLVGTTSAVGKLHVKTANGSISIDTAGSVGSKLQFRDTSGTETATIYNYGGSNSLLEIAAGTASGLIYLSTGSPYTERMRIDANGNVVINTAAIATNATNGFLYTASCAGAPTGAPTAYTGRIPMVVDTTNLRVYFNIGGTWRYATLT